MGKLISLEECRRRRDAVRPEGLLGDLRAPAGEALAPRPIEPPVFYFDPAAAGTYLAAERVERWFAGARWVPCAPIGATPDVDRAAAVGARAAALRLPLVWPESRPGWGTALRRVAALAAEQGASARFALAAGRLAYCGGFDVDDPEILAEAAAAAGLGMVETLRAAHDATRDVALTEATFRARRAGLRRLPGVLVGGRPFGGEERLGEALVAHRASAPQPARV